MTRSTSATEFAIDLSLLQCEDEQDYHAKAGEYLSSHLLRFGGHTLDLGSCGILPGVREASVSPVRRGARVLVARPGENDWSP